MAEKIFFPGTTPQWMFGRDCVAFLAIVNDKPVRCIISMEALFQGYGAKSGSEEDCMQAFNEHRTAIERQAEARINARAFTPEREVIIRASPEKSKGSRWLNFVRSPEIASRPEVNKLLFDVTFHYLGRFAPHGCETRVSWDYAGKPEDNLFQIKLEDPETQSSTGDWFSIQQLNDPEYLRRRFDFLWAEYLSARSKRQLEKIGAD
jgi:hypothetical protein